MKDNRVTQLASNITLFREQMCLSREELAEYIGCSKSLISKLENARTNDPGWILLDGFARLFGVSSSDLMNRDLSSIDIRNQAIKRIQDNFSESEWTALIDMVEGTTQRLARGGKFRKP